MLIHGYPKPQVFEPIDNAQEPNKVHCDFCGFICDTDRDGACPQCGSVDYNNNQKSHAHMRNL